MTSMTPMTQSVASLYKKVISGRPYWYLREMGWVDGKPKMVSERYLGSAAEIEALLDAREQAIVPDRIRHLDFGAVAAVWGLLSDLGVTAVIDEACGPAPSGLPLSVGTYLALAVLNRVVDPCSKRGFADWWKKTAADLSSTGFDGDQDLPRSRVLSGCGAVVLGLELNGRDKADLAVKAAVIEPVDVLGDRDLQVVDGAPRAFVTDEFGLEQAVERLGHGVVIRVALAAHGGDRAGLEQALGVADGDVLHAAIGVVHQRGDVVAVASAGPKAHLQGVEREVGAQRGGGLPADDAPAEHVEDERAVHPAGEGADVGQVGHPQAVLRGGGEVALHEVRPAVRAGPGQRRPRAFRAGDAPQASGFHQPLHRAAGDRPGVHTAGTAELRVDLADPTHAVVLLVHLADLGRDLLIADRPRRGRPGPRRVVGARGDRDISAGQHRADRLDPERVPVLLDVVHDQREGRSSAAAKKTDADSRIAFARRSSRTSRSSSPSRAASAVVVPGRAPASTSAWVTQPRSVSGLIPSCSPIRRHALGRDAGS